MLSHVWTPVDKEPSSFFRCEDVFGQGPGVFDRISESQDPGHSIWYTMIAAEALKAAEKHRRSNGLTCLWVSWTSKVWWRKSISARECNEDIANKAIRKLGEWQDLLSQLRFGWGLYTVKRSSLVDCLWEREMHFLQSTRDALLSEKLLEPKMLNSIAEHLLPAFPAPRRSDKCVCRKKLTRPYPFRSNSSQNAKVTTYPMWRRPTAECKLVWEKIVKCSPRESRSSEVKKRKVGVGPLERDCVAWQTASLGDEAVQFTRAAEVFTTVKF